MNQPSTSQAPSPLHAKKTKPYFVVWFKNTQTHPAKNAPLPPNEDVFLSA